MSVKQKQHTLSKSTFIRGAKCLKSLYLYKHHYDQRDETSAAQQAIFDQGHEVGAYAHQLFPGGVDCSVVPAYDYANAVKKTDAVLKAGAKVLYEAAFMYNNVYAAVDILVIRKDGWYVYEVKSTTTVKDYHYLDAAIQYYILQGLGLPVKAMHVVHINNQYKRLGDVEPKKLFTIADVTAEAIEQQLYVNEQLPIMFNVLNSGSIPNMEIGPQCEQYYGCDYQGTCWKHFEEVEFPVTEITRIGEKKWELIKQGIFCQTKIEDEFKLSATQRMQVICNKTKTSPGPDREGISAFLEELKHPLAFLDFETFSTAIPLFDHTKPYQQVPFQYSIHKMKDEAHEHYAFLGDGKTDPRKLLLEKMLDDLDGARSILCYNMSFEKSRINELAEVFPKYKKHLDRIAAALVDLIIPFRKHYVYDYRMNGSASIKSVLPALLPHLSYDDLEISEGGSASMAYLDLYVQTDEAIIHKTRENLLAYCKMDTLAMVELWRYLKAISKAFVTKR